MKKQRVKIIGIALHRLSEAAALVCARSLSVSPANCVTHMADQLGYIAQCAICQHRGFAPGGQMRSQGAIFGAATPCPLTNYLHTFV